MKRVIPFLLLALFSTSLRAISLIPAFLSDPVDISEVDQKEDCDKIESGEYIDSYISDIQNIQDTLICRSSIKEAKQDKKGYCECVRAKLTKPIAVDYFESINNQLQMVSMVDQTSDYMTSYLNLKSGIDRVIKRSTSFYYTNAPDRSLYCNQGNLNNIFSDLEKGKIAGCNDVKLDHIFSSLSQNGAILFGETAESQAMLKEIPKNFSSYASQLKEQMNANSLHQEVLNTALVDLISLFSIKNHTPIDAQKIELYTKIFSNDPLFSTLTVKLPNGAVINPKGKHDISDSLHVDPAYYPTIPLYLPMELVSKAISEKNIDLGDNAYADKRECEKISATFSAMCGTLSDQKNYMKKVIEDDPKILLDSLDQQNGNSMTDMLVPGAVQCYLGGYGKGFVDEESEAYLHSQLPFLFNFDKNKVGDFLADDSYYKKLMSSYGETSDVGPKSPDKEKQILRSRVEKAAEQFINDKDYDQNLRKAAKRNQNGTLRIDASAAANPHNSLADSLITTFRGKSHTQQQIDSPASTASVSSVESTPTINYTPNHVPQLGNQVNRQENSQPERASSNLPLAAATNPTSSFEERLAKIFEQQKAGNSDAHSETLTPKKQASDYRLSRSQEQIDQLKKELAEMKKQEIHQAAPAITVSQNNQSTGYSAKASASRGLEPASSNNTSSNSNGQHAVSAPRSVSAAASAAAPSSGGASSSGASAASAPSYEAPSKSSGFSSSKGGSGGSGFTLSREEVGQGDRMIIPASSFNADDSEYLKKLFEQTKGEPIFLSQTDSEGREKFVMLEAVVKADGSIEYIPAEQKDSRAPASIEGRPKYSGRGAASAKEKKKRTKVEDLKSLLGEQL